MQASKEKPVVEANEKLYEGLEKPVESRRSSWIGVDYFQALRQEQLVDHEQLRRIPKHISNILCIRYSLDGGRVALSTADGSIGVSSWVLLSALRSISYRNVARFMIQQQEHVNTSFRRLQHHPQQQCSVFVKTLLQKPTRMC